MDLLEMADSIEVQKQHAELRREAESLGHITEEDLGLFETMIYLEVKREDLYNDDIMTKVREVYDYAKEFGDTITILRDLDIELGMPIVERLDKLWSHVRLNNNEKRDNWRRLRKNEEEI